MRYPPPALVATWLVLLALLALTVLLAGQPLGRLNAWIALGIAVCKALLICAVFMELRHRNGLTLAFASAGFLWLGVLLWLAGTDFVTRANFPPPLTP